MGRDRANNTEGNPEKMADKDTEQGTAGASRMEVDGPGLGPGWHGRGKASQGNGGRYRLTGRPAQRAKEREGPGIVLPLVQRHLSGRHEEPDPGRRQDVLHPSEMAKEGWCSRASYFRLQGRLPARTRSFSMTLANVFAEGHAIHAKWQSWMAETGQLWGDWHCRRCLAIVRRTDQPEEGLRTCGGGWKHKWEYQEVSLFDAETNIYGHEDGALTGENCLVEIKSIGIGTLRWENPELLSNYYVRELAQYDMDGLWRAIRKPFLSHVRQVNIYMWLARQMGLPFDKTAVVYEFKVNQQVKEFQVKYSPEIAEPLIGAARDIAAARKEGREVPCPYGVSCPECRPYEPQEISSPEVPGEDRRADSSSGPAPARVRRGERRVQRGRLHEEPGHAADGDGQDPGGVPGGAEGDGP